MPQNVLFDESYQRLFGDDIGLNDAADEFFERFYGHFLNDPSIQALFNNTDMQSQVKMLKNSMFQLITFHLTHRPLPALKRLASLHRNLDIPAEMFDVWLDALIQTVREFDGRCDLATEYAWRWALAPGITYMKLVQNGDA